MNERSYERVADEYLREYGEQLRGELNGLERNRTGRLTPVLDHRVRRGIAAHKRARFARYAGPIAACLLIALAAPFLLRLPSGGNGSTAPAPPAASTPVPAAPASGAGASSAPVYELLPLSFDLPDRFSVASVEQDGEKTVYRLGDSGLDDVVLTMERSGNLSRYDNLAALSVGGHGAYGGSGDGYSLLAFADKDRDVLYVLTCKYDINTLVLLGKTILN